MRLVTFPFPGVGVDGGTDGVSARGVGGGRVDCRDAGLPEEMSRRRAAQIQCARAGPQPGPGPGTRQRDRFARIKHRLLRRSGERPEVL